MGRKLRAERKGEEPEKVHLDYNIQTFKLRLKRHRIRRKKYAIGEIQQRKIQHSTTSLKMKKNKIHGPAAAQP